jgi:tetratricopeptide (TPR) repeat protein
MIGRDKEKSDVIATLLNCNQAHIAILGAGEMGKTTLALSVLHDFQVTAQYELQYFISCEAVSSVLVLLGEIANALRIPHSTRDEHLYDVILSSLHQKPAVLCLDNFETIWDNAANRPGVEEFLSHISSIPELALIVTMRGTQRPSGVTWSKPLLPPLNKLGLDSSNEIFEKICGPVDKSVDKLLRDVDGIPLAITLIGSLLQEGNESSKSLWARWKKTHTKVVEVGSKGRLSNLDTSIHLSVYSPRMQADPNAISILSMLSLLPDGFPDAAIEDLQNHLPAEIDLSKLLQALQQVSLIHIGETTNPDLGRFCMLSPIRFFCQRNVEIPSRLRNSLVSFYTEMMSRNDDYTNEVSHAVVPPELLNIHSVFLQVYQTSAIDDSLLMASLQYTKWSLYVGNPVEDIMLLAIERISGSPNSLARCLSCLSEVYIYGNKLDKAEASLKHAIKLHKQTHSVLGEANNLQSLGGLYLQQDKLNEAKACLNHAIELHKEAHSVLGEANDFQSLGDLYLREDKLDKAEAYLKHAVELHKQSQDILGEAYDLQKLGELYLQKCNVDEAKASLVHAIKLHRQAQDILGEANSLQILGDLYLQQDKLDEAEASLNQAVKLHKQIHSGLGHANDLQSLGDVYLQQNRLDEAKITLNHALELHKQAHSILGEANDLQTLGDLYLRKDKFNDAEAFLKYAIELHKQAQSIPDEAKDLQILGDLYLKQGRLDKAEAALNHALKLHQQSHSVLGEAYDLQRLGDLCLQQDKLDEAEVFLNYAIKLHHQSQAPHGLATDQRLLELVQKYKYQQQTTTVI